MPLTDIEKSKLKNAYKEAYRQNVANGQKVDPSENGSYLVVKIEIIHNRPFGDKEVIREIEQLEKTLLQLLSQPQKKKEVRFTDNPEVREFKLEEGAKRGTKKASVEKRKSEKAMPKEAIEVDPKLQKRYQQLTDMVNYTKAYLSTKIEEMRFRIIPIYEDPEMKKLSETLNEITSALQQGKLPEKATLQAFKRTLKKCPVDENNHSEKKLITDIFSLLERELDAQLQKYINDNIDNIMNVEYHKEGDEKPIKEQENPYEQMLRSGAVYSAPQSQASSQNRPTSVLFSQGSRDKPAASASTPSSSSHVRPTPLSAPQLYANFWAAYQGNNVEEVIRLIQVEHVNLDTPLQNIHGGSALHWASGEGKIDMVQAFIKCGAMIDQQDEEGKTPLHYAINANNYKMAKVLINSGANSNITDHNGVSPYELARRSGVNLWDLLDPPPNPERKQHPHGR